MRPRTSMHACMHACKDMIIVIYSKSILTSLFFLKLTFSKDTLVCTGSTAERIHVLKLIIMILFTHIPYCILFMFTYRKTIAFKRNPSGRT